MAQLCPVDFDPIESTPRSVAPKNPKSKKSVFQKKLFSHLWVFACGQSSSDSKWFIHSGLCLLVMEKWKPNKIVKRFTSTGCLVSCWTAVSWKYLYQGLDFTDFCLHIPGFYIIPQSVKPVWYAHCPLQNQNPFQLKTVQQLTESQSVTIESNVFQGKKLKRCLVLFYMKNRECIRLQSL